MVNNSAGRLNGNLLVASLRFTRLKQRRGPQRE
jgi:hypothetical protein